jgi:hypothetical protein
MTDPGPFAPPPGALTPRSAVPPTPAPPATAPVLPPPTGLPIGPMLPAIPPPPRRRRWLVPVIAGGALAFVGLAVGVAVAAATLTQAAISRGSFGDPLVEEGVLPPESADLQEGEPGSPLAVHPLDCDVCFVHDSIVDLDAPEAAYTSLGLLLSAQASGSDIAGVQHRVSYDYWRTESSGPDACFFTYPYAPIAAPESDFMLSSDPGYDDEVYFYGYHSSDDQYYQLTPTGRLFDDTTAASAHMAELDRVLADCTGYDAEDDIGPFSIAVQEAPALTVPLSVAALVWTQSSEWGRSYEADLQRGNLVVRLTMNSDGYGATEDEFRRFVETYAQQLAALEPL